MQFSNDSFNAYVGMVWNEQNNKFYYIDSVDMNVKNHTPTLPIR